MSVSLDLNRLPVFMMGSGTPLPAAFINTSGTLPWANVAPSFSRTPINSFWNPQLHRWEPNKKEKEMLEKIVKDWKAKPDNPVDKWNNVYASG